MKTVRSMSLLFLLVGVIFISGWYQIRLLQESKIKTTLQTKDTSHDGTYRLGGQDITLVHGFSETPVAPGSASKSIVRYFGNDVSVDLDQDGVLDRAFIITQETGGSGTFFYLVGLLQKKNGTIGTEGIFLGDRIAPQTTEVQKGNIVVVNFAERSPGESFAVPPSLGKSLYILFNPKTQEFGEVVQHFEGETR